MRRLGNGGQRRGKGNVELDCSRIARASSISITARKERNRPYIDLLESGFKLGYILSNNHNIRAFRCEVLGC